MITRDTAQKLALQLYAEDKRDFEWLAGAFKQAENLPTEHAKQETTRGVAR